MQNKFVHKESKTTHEALQITQEVAYDYVFGGELVLGIFNANADFDRKTKKVTMFQVVINTTGGKKFAEIGDWIVKRDGYHVYSTSRMNKEFQTTG